MRGVVYGLIILLAILHQDFWWWDDVEPLVFGFLPVGLAYHAAVSVAAAVLWAMAVRHCWSADADEPEPPASAGANPPVGATQPVRNRGGHA